MSTQAPFALRGRNPDILTSIANLSNDEVFTPPEFANRMLDTLQEAWAESNDGANIWADSSVTFLDPFTKSGVFLREITKRLVDGLVGEIPNLQDRVNHVLTKQVFGIGITELTSLLARRSVYCSKWANGEHSICTAFDSAQGNIWFERTEHTWVGGTEKVITMDENGEAVLKPTNGKCKFCGANQKEYDRDDVLESHAYAFIHTLDIKTRMAELFGEEMKFDVIIGNPPYQLSDGGFGASAAPIYQHFVEQAKKLSPRYLSMVIPSRWFGGGKGLNDFRKSMLSDRRLVELHDFLDASDAFPGVDISGGISYFIWTRDQENDCLVSTWQKGQLLSQDRRALLAPGSDIFIRVGSAIAILEKIAQKLSPGSNSIVLPGDKKMSQLVSASKPFGLRTYVRGHSDENPGDLTLYKFGEKSFISPSEITAGHELVSKYKVLTSYVAYDHGGNPGKDGKRRVFSKIQIAPPGSVCTETYLVIGAFDTEQEAENLRHYMRTKFFRFLVSLTMYSHHITRSSYQFVPVLPLNLTWTDELLASHFELNQEDIELISGSIQELVESHD